MAHQHDTKELERELESQLTEQMMGFNLSDQVFRSILERFLSDNNTFLANTTDSHDLHNEVTVTWIPEHQYCQFNFREHYKWWHYRLAVSIAVTGALTNLLTVSTLTRRNMATPTNLLLLGLAVADLLVEVEYIPYATSTLLGGDQLFQAKEHALYVLVHAHLSHVCHTIAIWLTVSLAVWRWVAVCRPHSAPTFCTMVRARRVLLAVYLASPALATPTFLLYTVRELPGDPSYSHHSKLYKVDFSSLALARDELLKKINFLVYSVVVKLVPCLLLAVLLPAIIRGMWLAKSRRQQLMGRKPSSVPAAAAAATINNGVSHTSSTKLERGPSRSSFGRKMSGRKSTVMTNGTDHVKTHKKNEGATERTTSMLVVVMLLFLLTEAPQGVLTVLSLVYGHDFFSDCYIQLGDFMDLLALINSSINFLLYCVMSKQFRDTFVSLYCGCCRKRQRKTQAPVRPEHHNTATTYI
ncbi:G-protein coupled receptor dmsr-1-like isoform X2 [Panulirus ornatus]|uniref:G-protein coupled receptor dmsr-1-like isoform X2 n=1 Tax=Panulirus ornatus TaxID=150431 RepID=UPI003A8B5C4E